VKKIIFDFDAEIKKIENSFLQELFLNGFELCNWAVCKIDKNNIKLGIEATKANKKEGYKVSFGSEISLDAAEPANPFFIKKVNSINFPSSGCFDPTIRASYWRTIHAASILKNWKVACKIVNAHCKMYADLAKK
jgi:hypothetical protein